MEEESYQFLLITTTDWKETLLKYPEIIDSIADLMIKNKKIKVTISSKTDSRGTFKKNH